MKNEICENCGAEIGQLERTYIYEKHVICPKCYTKLKGETSDSSRTTMTKPGKVTAIGGMRLGSGICNILAGIVFCWLLFPKTILGILGTATVFYSPVVLILGTATILFGTGIALHSINKFLQITHFKLARSVTLCLNGVRERQT